MSPRTSRDTKVVSLNVQKPIKTVRERVLHLKAVLLRWVAEGVPSGSLSSLPTSLTAARKWEDTELGIVPISSPNEFTTKHAEWGNDVKDIGALLTKLHERYERPKGQKGLNGRKRDASAAISRSQKLEAEAKYAKAASDYHMDRAALADANKRADSADRKRQLVEAEKDRIIEELRCEIAALTRQLNGRNGLTIAQ